MAFGKMALRVIVTSDVHGEYGRFGAMGEELRKRRPDLLIDNGDLLQGSLLDAYLDRHPQRCHPMIELANAYGYDCAVYGNHEFQAPPASLQAVREQSRFPWISCNIGDAGKPYIIKTIRGIKVAVLGVTTHHTPLWDEFGTMTDLRFEDALPATRRWVSVIREKEQPDFLIVSYHGGFAEDPSGEWVFDQHTGENEGLAMLELDGVDLLITGHQHLCLQGERSGTPYIQPGSHGAWFADLKITREGGRWRVQSELVPVRHTRPELPEMEAWLSEQIGCISEDLTYFDPLQMIANGHPYLDWFHQFQLSETSADLSVTELFFNLSGGFHGVITRRELLHNYPRQHRLVVLALSGQAIVEAIEQSVAALALNEKNEIDYAYRVYPRSLQPYLYDFWGGLSFRMDLTRPTGNRVFSVTVKTKDSREEPLVLNKTYTVAMNSFRALGNEFPMFKNAERRYISSEPIPVLLEKYVQRRHPIN